ncbi:MAG: protein kinase [Planctomycetaceae bacterium]
MTVDDRTFVPPSGSDFDKPTLLSTESEATITDSALDPLDLQVPGYRVVREIARGGMGRILQAYDQTLEREVAIKVLLPGAPAARFVRESRITARLNHPGIPPVHGMGSLPDGVTFLAMKLVIGHTMAKEMEARGSSLLEIFHQVCHAVGYAHSKGIIHRDLKPANVMVGEFGEVQVMDWGLARDTTVAESDLDPALTSEVMPGFPESAQQSTQGQSDHRTVLGSVMGTPSYMAPEQARGEIADARADVFSLGAILCEILTGTPPFTGGSVVNLIEMAASARLERAMKALDECDADPDLVSLCKSCLLADRDKRPQHAGELQDALTKYRDHLNERLQSAERERAVAETRLAEQRKRRRVQRLLAVVVLAFITVGTLFYQRYRDQAHAREIQVERSNEAMKTLLEQAKTALTKGQAEEAEVLLTDAQSQIDQSIHDGLRQQLKLLQQDLLLYRELKALDEFRWTPTGNQLPSVEAVANRITEVLKKFGMLLDVPSTVAIVQASAVKEPLMGAMDRLLLLRPSILLRDILRGVDDDPFRKSLRTTILRKDWKGMAELASSEEILKQPPLLIALLGDASPLPVNLKRSVLAAAVANRPSDHNLLLTLASSYASQEPKDQQEAVRWLQAGIAVAPDSAAAYCNLGSALRRLSRFEEAKTAFETAIECMPEHVNSYLGLGLTQKQLNDLPSSIATFRKAREMSPENVDALNGLASSLASYGNHDEASQILHKVLTLDPNNAYAVNNVRKIDELSELSRRLPAVVAGTAEPTSPTDAMEIARLAARPAHAHYQFAVKLMEKTITTSPELASDIKSGYRYDTACAAAKAASLPDSTAEPKLPAPEERTRLRALALACLRADLDAMKDPAVDAATKVVYRDRLRQTQKDVDFVSVRATADRSEWTPEEIAAWDAYWADVSAVLTTLESP